MNHMNEMKANEDERRKQAEGLLKKNKKRIKEKAIRSEGDLLKLVHELEVHQIELKLQNEELVLARIEAQEALDKYTELFDFSPSGYLIISREGQIIGLNFSLARMLKKERQFLINRNFINFLSTESKESFQIFLDKVFISQRSQSSEFVLNKKVFFTNIYCTAVVSKETQVCHITIVDVTENNKLAQEKVQLQAKLFHTSKLALVGTLAAGIAHEINNPLTIILGLTEIIQDECGTACKHGVSDKLVKLEKAANRIVTIVNSIQSFARKDMDTQEEQEVHSCINETLLMVKSLYEKNNLQIKEQLEPQDFWITAKRGQLQQLLVNIISNAKDSLSHHKNGLISITTTINSDLGDNKILVIKISDNGTGIPKQFFSKLFDPFFTTKALGQGTGLGLSICYTIVKNLDGEIKIESEIDQGTTVTILLPSKERFQILSRSIAIRDDVNFHLTGKVLVVDDESNIREILGAHLASFGLQVFQAENGEIAYQMIAKENFDYVITDVKMTQMNGIELLKKIQDEDLAKNTKFLIISGGIEEHLKQEIESLERKIDGYLAKPFIKQDIIKIFKVLKNT